MSDVIVRNTGYKDPALRSILFEMIDSLIAGCIQKHNRVLIKPNLLIPAKPEKAIVTHPLIVRIVTEYVLECGAEVRIQDSPAMGTFDRVLKESAYRDAFEDLDVEIAPFKASVKKDIGSPFGAIDMAQEAIEADLVINIANSGSHCHAAAD